MITIKISEEVETISTMIYLLELIVKQIEDGNTSGVNPSWELEGEEELEAE